MTDDLIRIFIRDCRIDLNIGFYESEQRRTQPVIINVECEARLTRRYDDIAEKDLSAVINYKPIHHFISEELTKAGHIYLLESAAEKIIDCCFCDPRIQRASVRIEKTTVFPDAAGAGVEMERTRS